MSRSLAGGGFSRGQAEPSPALVSQIRPWWLSERGLPPCPKALEVVFDQRTLASFSLTQVTLCRPGFSIFVYGGVILNDKKCVDLVPRAFGLLGLRAGTHVCRVRHTHTHTHHPPPPNTHAHAPLP